MLNLFTVNISLSRCPQLVQTPYMQDGKTIMTFLSMILVIKLTLFFGIALCIFGSVDLPAYNFRFVCFGTYLQGKEC